VAEGYATAVGNATTVIPINYATAPAIDAIVVSGWGLFTGTGTVALEWAQNTSEATDTKVWARSFIKGTLNN